MNPARIREIAALFPSLLPHLPANLRRTTPCKPCDRRNRISRSARPSRPDHSAGGGSSAAFDTRQAKQRRPSGPKMPSFPAMAPRPLIASPYRRSARDRAGASQPHGDATANRPGLRSAGEDRSPQHMCRRSDDARRRFQPAGASHPGAEMTLSRPTVRRGHACGKEAAVQHARAKSDGRAALT